MPDSAAKKPRTNWLAVWRKRLEYVRKGRTMLERKPVLCVVAGPNGSGKTSTTVRLLSNEWASDCIYINPDDIAQNDFGDWNSGDAILKAARKATEMRDDCLERKVDFVFETVFSSVEKLTFLQKAKETGFFIRLFFVCTDDPAINIQRIYQRYINGGHEVPMSKVTNRYYKSLINMSKAIRFVDRSYIYDNSVDNRDPQLLFRTESGVMKKRYTDEFPEWTKPLIESLIIDEG